MFFVDTNTSDSRTEFHIKFVSKVSAPKKIHFGILRQMNWYISGRQNLSVADLAYDKKVSDKN
jgi:hypothetical protein